MRIKKAVLVSSALIALCAGCGPGEGDIARAYSRGYFWGETECKGDPVPMAMDKEFDDSLDGGQMAAAYKQGWQAGYTARGCTVGQ